MAPGEGLPSTQGVHDPAQIAPARTNIRFMFHAIVTRCHSPRTLSRPRRVEPRDDGVEHEADVRPGGRDLSRIVHPLGRWKTLAGRHRPIEAAKIAASSNSTALRRSTKRQTASIAILTNRKTQHPTPT